MPCQYSPKQEARHEQTINKLVQVQARRIFNEDLFFFSVLRCNVGLTYQTVSQNTPTSFQTPGYSSHYNMSVCGYCDKTHLKLREDIHRRRADIQEKNELLESLMLVAFAQSKRIFYLQASALTNPAVLSPSWLSQALISDSLPVSRGCSQSPLVPVSLIHWLWREESLMEVDQRTWCCMTPLRPRIWKHPHLRWLSWPSQKTHASEQVPDLKFWSSAPHLIALRTHCSGLR